MSTRVLEALLGRFVYRAVRGLSLLCILCISGAQSARAETTAACTDHITNLNSVALNKANAVYCLDNDITSGSGAFSIQASGITLDGQNHTVSVSSGIYVTSGSKSNITIRNIKFTNGGFGNGDTQHDVSCASNVCTANYWITNWSIENSSFKTSGRGYSPWNQLSVLNNFSFKNNTVELLDSAGNMVQMHWVINSTFEGNTFKHTVANSSQTDESFGIMLRDASSHNIFRNNIIATNSHNCMMLTGSGTGMKLKTVNDTRSSAFGYDNTLDSNVFISLPNSIGKSRDGALARQAVAGEDHIKNNIFYGVTTAGMSVTNGQSNINGEIDHNTFINTTTSAYSAKSSNGASSNALTNNIFYGPFDPLISNSGSNHNLNGVNPNFVSALPTWSSLSNSADLKAMATSIRDALHLASNSPAKGAASDGTDLGVNFGTAPTATPTPSNSAPQAPSLLRILP